VRDGIKCAKAVEAAAPIDELHASPVRSNDT
jgi:hypothetical protein